MKPKQKKVVEKEKCFTHDFEVDECIDHHGYILHCKKKDCGFVETSCPKSPSSSPKMEKLKEKDFALSIGTDGSCLMDGKTNKMINKINEIIDRLNKI